MSLSQAVRPMYETLSTALPLSQAQQMMLPRRFPMPFGLQTTYRILKYILRQLISRAVLNILIHYILISV
jgi:hypothetical protein